MTPETEVNVITIQAPDGTKQRVAVNSRQTVLFTGEIPCEAVGAVVKALLYATRDASFDEETPKPFAAPFSDDQCVPMTSFTVAPTDNPDFFRMAFAFGRAELHIALDRPQLRPLGLHLMKMAGRLHEADETDDPNKINVATGVPNDGKNILLEVSTRDDVLVDTVLPPRAVTPLVARLLDAAVSCARKDPHAHGTFREGFDEDLCVHADRFAIAQTKMPDAFGLSFEFGAEQLHIALPRQSLQLLGTGLLTMARDLGVGVDASSAPSRASSGLLGRLWGRGSADG
jgi:hypothetical protein